MRYEMLSTGFRLSLAQGLVAVGLARDGLASVDDTVKRIETKGDLVHMPEALRVKASVLLALQPQRQHEATTCLVQSLDWSRHQGARSWELRAALDLASLQVSQQQVRCARATLAPALEKFTEGFDTADVKAAAELLACLPVR